MGRRRERGVALIIVLWVFMVLGVLALDFGRYVRDDAMAAVNFAEETQGYYVALAGMNRTLFAYGHDEPDNVHSNDPENIGLDDLRIETDNQWHAQTFADGHYEVRLTDESGLIPINAGNINNPENARFLETVLRNVVRYLVQGGNRTTGLDVQDTRQIDTLVDSILDWRDRGSEVRANGAERDCPLERGRPYHAPNRAFLTREELLEVCGMTPALFYGNADVPGLRDVVSVWASSLKINPRRAPALVLQVLTGGDAAGAAELLAQRDTEEDLFTQTFQALLMRENPELAPFAQTNFVADDSKLVFIEARADVRATRNQAHIAAVVDLKSDSGAEVVQPLHWFDRAPWTGHLPGLNDVREGEAK